MMMYRYTSAEAAFELRPQANGEWDILVCGVATLTFPTAAAACEAVAAHASGYSVWDHSTDTAPADLAAWEQVET